MPLTKIATTLLFTLALCAGGARHAAAQSNITLRAGAITLTVFTQKADGSPGTPVSSTVAC